jgi:hypothetical protein
MRDYAVNLEILGLESRSCQLNGSEVCDTQITLTIGLYLQN